MQARLLLFAVVVLEILLGISPKADRLTWALENAPVWIGIAILVFAWPKFRLTNFCLTLLAIHAVILMIGGHYTYAKVPVGDWAKAAFDLQRNPYDRLGHFVQGFVPAILVRELLLRKADFKRNLWMPFLTICVCLAFSAFYELIEWWTALLTGEAAADFLGTQGDIWDTQWDMFLALVGAICSVVFLSARHDRSLARMK